MQRDELAECFEKVFEECGALREAGQKEYAHREDDAFANFKRVGKLLNLPMTTVLMVYLLKHVDGIVAWVKGHRSQREDVRGRINDGVVYLGILRGMVDELEREEAARKAADQAEAEADKKLEAASVHVASIESEARHRAIDRVRILLQATNELGPNETPMLAAKAIMTSMKELGFIDQPGKVFNELVVEELRRRGDAPDDIERNPIKLSPSVMNSNPRLHPAIHNAAILLSQAENVSAVTDHYVSQALGVIKALGNLGFIDDVDHFFDRLVEAEKNKRQRAVKETLDAELKARVVEAEEL